jgi:hypothetical protein
MPRPSRRTTTRRSGSYSSRPSVEPRRAGGGRNGYRSGAGSRGAGDNQVVLYSVIAVAGLVLVIALVVLLSRSGDSPKVEPVAENPQPEKRAPPVTVDDGDGPRVLVPFTSEEKARIRSKIEELDRDYDRAKDLSDAGHLAHARQDYEDAQAAWQEAYSLLRHMQGEAELLLEPFGDDAWDRLERFMPTESRTTERWDKLMREFYKYLNRK